MPRVTLQQRISLRSNPRPTEFTLSMEVPRILLWVLSSGLLKNNIQFNHGRVRTGSLQPFMAVKESGNKGSYPNKTQYRYTKISSWLVASQLSPTAPWCCTEHMCRVRMCRVLNQGQACSGLHPIYAISVTLFQSLYPAHCLLKVPNLLVYQL